MSGSKEPPAPIAITRAALVDDIEGWLADQVAALRAEAGYVAESSPKLWTRFERVEQRAGWLLRHLTVLLASPFGATAGLELLELHDRARKLLGLNDPPIRLPAPCFVCDTRALVRHNGEDFVRCEERAGGCGRRWSEEEYGWLVHASAADVDPPVRQRPPFRLASGMDGSGGRG